MKMIVGFKIYTQITSNCHRLLVRKQDVNNTKDLSLSACLEGCEHVSLVWKREEMFSSVTASIGHPTYRRMVLTFVQ